MPETPNHKLRDPPVPPAVREESPLGYAELDVTSNFSFLRGASHPDELVFRAAELGHRAIAITDINSLAGVVRAHDATRQVREQGGRPPKLIIGSRLTFEDAPDLLVWATDRAGYGRLCRLLTLGKRRAEKGECALRLDDFIAHSEGLLAAVVHTTLAPVRRSATLSPVRRARGDRVRGSREGPAYLFTVEDALKILHDVLGDRLSLASNCIYGPDDASRIAAMTKLARRVGVPLLATNNVHYHVPERRMLQDVLTCIRHGCTIHEAGFRLFPNGERYLKTPAQMHRLFADFPAAIHRGIEIADRCNFSLDELKYEYPHELVPEGKTPIQFLTELTWKGAAERYAVGTSSVGATHALPLMETRSAIDSQSACSTEGEACLAPTALIPESVSHQISHELKLIEQLKYEPYFLTVWDLVKFARSRGILCQGRGSAANSAVCYCLGITSVDPARIDLLFERFVSAARNEPPDIDVDFEHERREEVIQYIYEKYGRDRAGMTAEVITYRGRSAVRDVGKALGLSLDLVDSMAKKLDWWDRGAISEEHLRELGLDPNDRTVRLVVDLTGQILGFPRHLSQHVGGMVMTRGPLCELVPIENASMANRTVIEWDKDDIDALGMLKVDVLALGMLTCIAKAFGFINVPLQLHTIPPEDPNVYAMLSDADSVGVFQVESRAQMSMLPRLRPRCFYDLVIEVAIVRPGPIQGNMVHPYLRRRNGEEPVEFPSEALRKVLEKTLGVPLFQEQAMRVAMVGAGFSAEEADKLRRAMAAWRKNGALEGFRQKIIDGMLRNGYTPQFAEQCFLQIRGFGEYGFPESHSASFALLVYVSAWLKRYHPAAFCAALLNSQPMGFYAPAQIVRDAREHGVEVRAVDVNASEWDCALEENSPQRHGGTEANFRKQIVQEVNHSTLPMRAFANSSSNANAPPCLRAVVNRRCWGADGPAVRLGFRQVKGLREAYANQIVAARQRLGRFVSIAQFHLATGLSRTVLHRLAEADAFASLGFSRREALWRVMEIDDAQLPLFDDIEELSRVCFSTPQCDVVNSPNAFPENGVLKHTLPGSRNPEAATIDPRPQTLDSSPSCLRASVPSCLPQMPLGQEVMIDYSTVGLSLKRHPVSLARDQLTEMGVLTSEQMSQLPHGRWVSVAGLVLIRQRPGTASGIVFETLEDETGIVNLIIRPNIYDKYRLAARHAGLLNAQGNIERQGQVIHVMVWRLYDLSDLLAGCQFTSRDFH